MQVKVEYGRLHRALRESVQAARDTTPLWKDIGALVLNSVRENFMAGGRPDRWVPISHGSLIAKHGGVRKVFTKRGRLRRSKRRNMRERLLKDKLLVDSTRLMSSITRRLVHEGVEIGTNVIYAAAHQFGRDDGKRGSPLPARPYLVVQDDDEIKIEDIIEQHMIGALQRA